MVVCLMEYLEVSVLLVSNWSCRFLMVSAVRTYSTCEWFCMFTIFCKRVSGFVRLQFFCRLSINM